MDVFLWLSDLGALLIRFKKLTIKLRNEWLLYYGGSNFPLRYVLMHRQFWIVVPLELSIY